MTDEGAYYDTGRIYSNYSQKEFDLILTPNGI